MTRALVRHWKIVVVSVLAVGLVAGLLKRQQKSNQEVPL